MTRTLILAVLLASLSSCATITPEGRVRHALVKAGIQPAVAQCMASRMVAKLSLAQLRRLQSVAEMPGEQVGRMTLHEIVHRVKALGDPEIVIVTSRAAIGCEIADG